MDIAGGPQILDDGGRPSPIGRDGLGLRLLASFGVLLMVGGLAWAASTVVAPDQASVRLLGHVMTVGDLRHHILKRLLMLGLLLPGVFMVELALVGWPNSSLRMLIVKRTPSSMTDLASFLFWQVRLRSWLMLIVSFGLTLISGAWIHDRLQTMFGFRLSADQLEWPIQLFILYFVYSFFDYWNHRLDHSSVFWPLHRYHHAADDFCVLNSVRTHPAVFTSVVSSVLPSALLGFSPHAIVLMNLFATLLRYVIHSRIDSNFGWVGRYVIQSPVHHRLHHILDTTQPTGHFSLVPLWDHLFGTWRGDADQSLAIGVDTPYRHGAWLVPDLWRDYRDFWKGLATNPFRRRPRSARPARVQP